MDGFLEQCLMLMILHHVTTLITAQHYTILDRLDITIMKLLRSRPLPSILCNKIIEPFAIYSAGFAIVLPQTARGSGDTQYKYLTITSCIMSLNHLVQQQLSTF